MIRYNLYWNGLRDIGAAKEQKYITSHVRKYIKITTGDSWINMINICQ